MHGTLHEGTVVGSTGFYIDYKLPALTADQVFALIQECYLSYTPTFTG